MSDWRTVGVRLKEEDVGQLNRRLKQLGYGSLNEFVGGITAGVVTNKQVVEELAEALAGKIVNKLLSSTLGKDASLGKFERRRRDLNSQALSDGSFPGCWVTRLPIRRPCITPAWRPAQIRSRASADQREAASHNNPCDEDASR